MALQFLKMFQPVQLGTSAAAIYTVPTSPTTTLLQNGRVQLTNTTSSSATATLYAVPAAGADSATNEFFPGQSIGPNSFVQVDVPQLAAGDAIWASAGTASAINIQAISGVLQS